MIRDLGAGILIYEQQEGRGIGLMAKLQAYELQDSGLDTVEANERLGFKADQRDFALPGQMLKALGISACACFPIILRRWRLWSAPASRWLSACPAR